MARIETDPNYSSPTFSRATAATDPFKKEDVQAVAAALSTHDHTNGKGVAVGRASSNLLVDTLYDLTYSKPVLNVANISSAAVNYFGMLGASAGSYPQLQARGSDAAIGIDLNPKAGGANVWGMRIVGAASAVNYLQVTSGATGGAVQLAAIGTDTNISLWINAKGSGSVSLGAPSAPSLSADTVPSAVNFIRVAGVTTGNDPVVQADGSDANTGLSFNVKNNGTLYKAFRVVGPGVAGGVVINYAQLTASSTGNPVNFVASGGDANIHLGLAGKGTGLVFTASDFKFGAGVGFFNANPVAKPTVSGAKGGNAALASLMTALSGMGLVTDSTS